MSDERRTMGRYGTLDNPAPIGPIDPDRLMQHYMRDHGPPPDFVKYPRLLAQHRIAHVLAEQGHPGSVLRAHDHDPDREEPPAMSDEITITRGKRRDGGPLLFAHADVSDLSVQAGPEWPDAMLDAGIAPGPTMVGGSDPSALDALAARISETADELRRAIRERWRCVECRDDRWTVHVEGDHGMRQCVGCESIDRSEKQRLPDSTRDQPTGGA